MNLFKEPDISAVFIEPEDTGDKVPWAELAIQERAPVELTRISQAPGKLLTDYKNRYIYDASGGEGVDLYIIDTGAHLEHHVSNASLYT